jgi:hypothetical protein
LNCRVLHHFPLACAYGQEDNTDYHVNKGHS